MKTVNFNGVLVTLILFSATSSVFATTGIYSAGSGSKSNIGVFKTIDENDPVLGMTILALVGMVIVYYVWKFICFLLSSVRNFFSGVSGEINDVIRSGGKSHDFDRLGVCKKCGCTKKASENFRWRCSVRANAIENRNQDGKGEGGKVFASRTATPKPRGNIMNNPPQTYANASLLNDSNRHNSHSRKRKKT